MGQPVLDRLRLLDPGRVRLRTALRTVLAALAALLATAALCSAADLPGATASANLGEGGEVNLEHLSANILARDKVLYTGHAIAAVAATNVHVAEEAARRIRVEFEELPPVMDASADPATDPQVVAAVQRGLNSLGFLHAPVDGVAGETTAKAIRNFEVYFNYNVTGRVTRELVKLLQQNGAVI